ncbi:MAG: SDR family oxidoreductase [Actinomycetia bacterium]|nr:SDR family oxidoreductase [Actinomycetes bacterium]
MTDSTDRGTDDGTDHGGRRVALVANTSFYLGPPLARELARRGHDLVIGDPAEGLVEELEAAGSRVVVAEHVWNLADPDKAGELVNVGLDTFGRVDSAVAFTGQIIGGAFLDSTADQLATLEQGLIDAPYQFLKAVLPPMVQAGSGQVLVVTSSSGARVTPGASIYSALRAGATHLVKNVAREMAPNGVQVNSLGTNFMDFDAFLAASGADDPEVRKRVESKVPLGRLGTLEECAALCCAYLDGTCGFVTGQFVAHDGGWS